MQSFAMVFDSKDVLRRNANRLIKRHGVTGEIEIRPLGGGKWLLHVSSEKELRASTLEKLSGKRVDADSLGSGGEAGT